MADASAPAVPTNTPAPRETADYEGGEELSAGAASVRVYGRTAFEQPAPNVDAATRTRFYAGQAIFQLDWADVSATSDRAGLGPTFNATSCEACHARNGRGTLPAPGLSITTALVRLSVPRTDGSGTFGPDPVYGEQLQPFGISGVPGEGGVMVRLTERAGAYDDGFPYALVRPEAVPSFALGPPAAGVELSLRVAPATYGMGLLEAIPEADILANADPDDRDGNGISGRPNQVGHPTKPGAWLGRFGWKAGQPSVEAQNAAAFVGDIGVTSPLFVSEGCPGPQTSCEARASDRVELSASRLEALTVFTVAAGVPERRNADSPAVLRGKLLFNRAGCGQCHVPAFTTHAPESWRDGLRIRPYTDLLLHDMGDGLADRRPEGLASGTEWRTPPLWGLGLLNEVSGHGRLLHDGRARGFEEAILWHGGEGEASRRAFEALDSTDRAALVRFLESL